MAPPTRLGCGFGKFIIAVCSLKRRPDERVIVHYQAFFEEPEAELRKIATFAGLDGKETAAAAALVAVNRRHTAFTIEQMIDAGVSGQIVALYRSLIDGTAQPGKGTRKNKRPRQSRATNYPERRTN